MAQVKSASLSDYSHLDQSALVKDRKFTSTDDIPEIQDCEFVDCSFDDCNLSGASFSNCVFKGCSFLDCDMHCVRFFAVEFQNCVFGRGMWINVGLRESAFDDCSFSQTEFEDCLAVGCKFANVAWSDGSILHSCFDLCTFTATAFMGAAIHAIFHDCTICNGAFDHVLERDGASRISMTGHRARLANPVEDTPVLTPGGDNRKRSPAKPMRRRKSEDPLQEFIVRNRPTSTHLRELDHLLNTATDEASFQTFLERNPEVLSVAVELGHHGIYVRPQVPFGRKFRADFMVGAKNSMGYFWTGLEIESPRHKVLKRDGHFTQKVQHAIDQVEEWKAYVRNHRAEVQRPMSQLGECLIGIEAEFKAWIIIGRDPHNVTAAPRRDRYLNSHRTTHVQTWDGFRAKLAAAVEGEKRKARRQRRLLDV